MEYCSFRAHKPVIRFQIYALSLARPSQMKFQDVLRQSRWRCTKVSVDDTIAVYLLKFILVGLVTLIWWGITLIQWVTAFVMTWKAPLLRLVSSVKFPCKPARSYAPWEARYGLWFFRVTESEWNQVAFFNDDECIWVVHRKKDGIAWESLVVSIRAEVYHAVVCAAQTSLHY